VAFRFEKASCVVVGTFNMYILHQQWLAKHNIIEPDLEVGIETNLTKPGFRFRFPQNDPIWSVTPNRLAVESQDPQTDCGEIVAKVLAILPETPLFVLGNNFHYRAAWSERENLSPTIRNFPETDLPMLQWTYHAGIQRGERVTANIQIALKKDDSIELIFNIHNELGSTENANEEAMSAAKRFFNDRDETMDLAQQFFGISIDHAPDHT